MASNTIPHPGRCAAAIALLLTAACAESDGRGHGVTASVEFDSTRVLDDAAQPVLGRPALVSTDRHGRFIVADESDRNVKIYQPDGSRVATIGRAGIAPGEFMSLVTAQSFRDSILAYDFAQQRLSIFAPDGRMARMKMIRPTPFDVRVVDDSLLLLIRHPGQGGAHLSIATPDGAVGKAFFRGSFTRNKDLVHLTAAFADARDGYVFAAMFGEDSIYAYDYRGRRIAAGLIDETDPLDDMRTLLRRANGRVQDNTGKWFHDGMRALMKVVALTDGRAALFVAPYDTKVGTDLLEGGDLVVVGVRDDKIVPLARRKISNGLFGRDRDDALLLLGYTDETAEKVTVQRATIN